MTLLKVDLNHTSPRGNAACLKNSSLQPVTCGYMWLQVYYVQPKKVGFYQTVVVLDRVGARGETAPPRGAAYQRLD